MLGKLRYDLVGWASGLLSFSYNLLVYVNNNYYTRICQKEWVIITK